VTEPEEWWPGGPKVGDEKGTVKTLFKMIVALVEKHPQLEVKLSEFLRHREREEII
jgi:hypothetical protein